MRVLFIAPLPPPITGHSIASEGLLAELRREHDVDAVDLSLGSAHDGSVSRRRVTEVGRVLVRVWRARRWADVIYLTIAESLAGNLKDLAIYLICARRLRRMVIHLHGGSIERLLFLPRPLVRRANALALRRLGAIIVTGRSHERIFAPLVDARRIHVVANFAADELFASEAEVERKFGVARPLRILYVGGMARAKGYLDLLEGFLGLDAAARRDIHLDFAGHFDSTTDRDAFLARTEGLPGIEYHGVVQGQAKQRLFAAAHVFCLPTSMFEGQPIAILEAFAAGCVVVATGQDGIRDVFTPEVNGFQIDVASPRSVTLAIEKIREQSGSALLAIAQRNRRQAEAQFRQARFLTDTSRILFACGTAPTA